MRVLLIDVDSLRPDHLGCYGYSRNTSPTIDRIAESGVRFEQCFASDTPCLPSRTALATGRFGAKSGVVTHYGDGQWYEEPGSGHLPDPERPLSFRLLSEAGVHTATVSSFSKRHMAYHFSGGFRESIQPPNAGGGERGEEVTELATDWLARHATDDDWLLHVQYWDPHVMYHHVGEHVDQVRDSGSRPDWPDQDAIDDQQGMTGARTTDHWHFAGFYEEGELQLDDRTGDEWWAMPETVTTREDFERIVDGYDASIRKTDAEVAALLDALEDQGVREETAVIVTADHGEAMGEHGIYADHVMAHPSAQRVPLVVSWPGVTDDVAGESVDEMVYQFDLVPTLCDLLAPDLSRPDGWDARPVTSALRGDSFEGRDHLVCSHGTFTYGRAVYRDEWVYIRLFHPGVMSHPGLYNDPALPNHGLELLHDRTADPGLAENVIQEEPDVARELRSLLNEWTTRTITSEDAEGTDPLAAMAVTDGPFLYNDPVELRELYGHWRRSDGQRSALDRSTTAFPIDWN